MIFSSNVFLFAYLPLVLALYFISPRKLRNPVLLLTSLLFYGWGEPIYLILMIATIALDYGCGLLIHKYQDQPKAQKTVLILGVAFTLLWALIAAKLANKAQPKTLNRAVGAVLVILGSVMIAVNYLT